jgi:hypothetical protein
MATNLRERFGPKEPLSRGLLAEDFVFSPAEHGALRNYRIERESVTMLETPLAVSRRYVLSRAPEGVQLELALCLEGGDAAVALLFQRAEAFQRKPADDAIIDMHVGFSDRLATPTASFRRIRQLFLEREPSADTRVEEAALGERRSHLFGSFSRNIDIAVASS